jgi:hypothetical protein
MEQHFKMFWSDKDLFRNQYVKSIVTTILITQLGARVFTVIQLSGCKIAVQVKRGLPHTKWPFL